MGNRAAVTLQADIARAIRAAKQAGAGSVRIRSDGTIEIPLEAEGEDTITSEAGEDAKAEDERIEL